MVRAIAEFAAASVLIVTLPGPDTLVVVRSLLRTGPHGGLRTALGVVSGLVVWVGGAVLGLSAVLRASHTGYDVLRAVGAAYLIWVGVASLSRRFGKDQRPHAETARRPLLGAGYLSGLATDLFNPKVGVFFVSFLPAFVPREANVGLATAAFGATFIIETLLYFLVLIALADRVTRWMTDARRRRQLDRAAGVIFVGFGVRLATESR